MCSVCSSDCEKNNRPIGLQKAYNLLHLIFETFQISEYFSNDTQCVDVALLTNSSETTSSSQDIPVMINTVRGGIALIEVGVPKLSQFCFQPVSRHLYF